MGKAQPTPAIARTSGTKVVLVTGASSGIGLTCCEYLAGKGLSVYGASRSLTAGVRGSFSTLRLDVTEDASVEQAVRTVHERQGRIDVVINNAGNGIAGAVEETSPQEALAQFDTNFFGV